MTCMFLSSIDHEIFGTRPSRYCAQSLIKCDVLKTPGIFYDK